MTLERGTLLNGRYRVVDILGQGGMGSVYRAVDENLGVDVALKENLFTTDEYARQFRREAVILATLRHPNLTRVTDHFVIEGQGQYLVMDYIEGEDLRERMDRVGLISEEEVTLIGAAVCDALSYLATRTPPIVHRDIKPGNVKITPNGQIFLVDFGLAKIVQGGQATTTGARAMTPGYSPPEQYGTARTDHRSDLFSLGATLYAALTGVIPEDALARAMDQTELTPIRKHNPKISRRMAAIIEKSLSVRPDERYQSAEEFKQALLTSHNMGRRKTGDYMVTPPPLSPAGGGNSDASASGSGPPPYVFPEDHVNGMPIQISTPLPEISRSRWLNNLLRILLIVLLILAGGSLGVYLYDPALPAQALALILPSPQVSALPATPTEITPAAAIDLTATAAAAVLISTDTPEPANTPRPSATSITTPDPPTATPTLAEPTATPTTQPTPLGGGGEIAFASDRSGANQIWTMNSDGTHQRQLTDYLEGACQPAWSPDGSRIVFIVNCPRNQERYRSAQIYIMNADGSEQTQFFDVLGGDYDPAWSPDGTKIAFTSLRNGGRPRIYLLDVATLQVEMVSGRYGIDSQPAWSPDGRRIAFVTTQKGPVQIWSMNRDGSQQELYSRSGDAINSHPIWSLAADLILYTQLMTRDSPPHLVAGSYEEGVYNEFVYELGTAPAREAQYSPDGQWMVFESWPDGTNHDIYIMTAAGSGRTRLTDDPRIDFDPAWRPAPAN